MTRIIQITVECQTMCGGCEDVVEHAFVIEGPFFAPVDLEDKTHEHLKSEGWIGGLCPRCTHAKEP